MTDDEILEKMNKVLNDEHRWLGELSRYLWHNLTNKK